MKKILIATIFVILVLFFFMYPGEIPYSIECMGKINPIKEWNITRRNDGLIMATLQNHGNGSIEKYSVTQFERGDPVKFNVQSSIIPGASVTAGDTVGWIESKELKSRLVQLNGELRTQKDLLRMAMTGEKQTIIEEAQKRLEYAKGQVEEQKIIVNRSKTLYETKFIPFQDYEISQNTLRLLEINVEIAESHIRTLQSGSKKEEIDMISSQITSLGNMIDTLLEQYNDYTLLSPISGRVLDPVSGNVLDPAIDPPIVKVGDISSYSVIIPIQLKIRKYIELRQKIEIRMADSKISHYAEIIKIGNTVHIMIGDQYVMVIGQLNPNGEDILTGTITRCSVVCDPITLREYFFRKVNTLFNR